MEGIFQRHDSKKFQNFTKMAFSHAYDIFSMDFLNIIDSILKPRQFVVS